MTRRGYLLRHPACVLFYFAGAAGLAMCTLEPLCAALSLLGGAAALLPLKGVRAFFRAWALYLPLLFVLAAVNPFFSKKGLTLLFYVGGTPYTLEALCYGFSAGMALVAAMQWFSALRLALPAGRFLALFSKIAPVTASMVSMVFRFLPETLQKSRAILDAKRSLGAKEGGLRGAAGFSAALAAWSLEDSVETADSMRARGYGQGRRTSAHDLSLTLRDGAELLLLALLFACGVACAVRAGAFRFYPRLRFAPHGWEAAGYAAFVLLPALAGLLERAALRPPRQNRKPFQKHRP